MPLNDVPEPTQTLGVTQPLIKANFQTIDTAFTQDHVPYNLGGGGQQGKHKKITMPSGFAGQPFSFSAGEIGIQNLNQAPTNINDLWLSRGNVAAAYPTIFPMTGWSRVTVDPGWSYLPSGVIIQWGNSSANAFPATTTVTFGLAFPNQNISILISPRQQPFALWVSAKTNADFTISNTGLFTNFSWFAIGY